MTTSPPLQLVLHEPEIPPNTGNIIRLAANTGVPLHLIRPLGFRLDQPSLRRAGLDYDAIAQLQVHDDFTAYLAAGAPRRRVAFSRHADESLWNAGFEPGDALVFGPETRGLPAAVLARCDLCLRIPMQPGSRSLNLANAVAVGVYEAWRQVEIGGRDTASGRD